jgi:hypothetical protein
MVATLPVRYPQGVPPEPARETGFHLRSDCCPVSPPGVEGNERSRRQQRHRRLPKGWVSDSPPSGPLQAVARFSRATGRNQKSATAADRHATERYAAETTGLYAFRNAIAAGVHHVAARLVAARAGQANTILGHRALALAHRQIALANAHAVHRARATAHAAGEHLAHVLKHRASHLVFARAGDLHPALRLLEADATARHHAHVAHGGRHSRHGGHRQRHCSCRAGHGGTFEHRHTGH